MTPNQEVGINHHGQFLPSHWEQAYDVRTNRTFYVDHKNKKTTWLNPMDIHTKPKNLSECYDDQQLPYGWEKIVDPAIGVYYANHIKQINQWTNPVSDWRITLSQHHYSNSLDVMTMQQSGNSLDSNNQTTSQTTGDTKPDTSLHTSDIDDKFSTSFDNSNTMSEIVDTMRSSNSRGSKYDASLLDIMDNHFGRKSSQSVEV